MCACLDHVLEAKSEKKCHNACLSLFDTIFFSAFFVWILGGIRFLDSIKSESIIIIVMCTHWIFFSHWLLYLAADEPNINTLTIWKFNIEWVRIIVEETAKTLWCFNSSSHRRTAVWHFTKRSLNNTNIYLSYSQSKFPLDGYLLLARHRINGLNHIHRHNTTQKARTNWYRFLIPNPYTHIHIVAWAEKA